MSSTYDGSGAPGCARPVRQSSTNDDPTLNAPSTSVAVNATVSRWRPRHAVPIHHPSAVSIQPANTSGPSKKCHHCGATDHLKINCPIRVRKSVMNIPAPIKSFCAFCGAKHPYSSCTIRITWLNNFAKLSERERLVNIGIREHNAVELMAADWKSMDFEAYLYDTVVGHSSYCGGLAMKSRRVWHASSTKLDDFSAVSVTPLRQAYRWCREGVLEMNRASLPVMLHSDFFAQYTTAAEATAGYVSYGLCNPFWSATLKTLGDNRSGDECHLAPVYMECFAADLQCPANATWVLSSLRRAVDSSTWPSLVTQSDIGALRLLFGQAYTSTGWCFCRRELILVNYLRWGKPRMWVVVAEKDVPALILLFQQLYPGAYSSCPYAERHGNFMVLPNVLKAADPPIPFRTITQQPEHVVVVFPGAFFLVVDTGLCCSEEAYFGMKGARYDEYTIRSATMPGCRCAIRPTAPRALHNMSEKSCPNSLSLHSDNLSVPSVADSINTDFFASSVSTRTVCFVPGGTRLKAGVAVDAGSEKVAEEVIALDESSDEEFPKSPLAVLPALRLEHLPVLCVTDIDLLVGAQRLNDSLVDFFLALACRHYCTTEGGKPFICSSFLYRQFKRFLKSIGNVAVALPNLDMTTGTDKGPDLSDFPCVLMPVCDEDHWILFVIHKATGSGAKLLVFDSDTPVLEPRIRIINTVTDYVQRVICKASGGEDHCRVNVKVAFANVPRQMSGSLDCGAFVIYYAFKIMMRGLTGAVGQLSMESLNVGDYGPKMRDLLKEIVQLRLDMLKAPSMTSLQERERSRVLEVVLPCLTGELGVRKVIDWQCEAANGSYAASDAETVLALGNREEPGLATSAVVQTRTNGAEWQCWPENVPHVDSEAETVPDTGFREEYVPSTSAVAQVARTNWAACAPTVMTLPATLPAPLTVITSTSRVVSTRTEIASIEDVAITNAKNTPLDVVSDLPSITTAGVDLTPELVEAAVATEVYYDAVSKVPAAGLIRNKQRETARMNFGASMKNCQPPKKKQKKRRHATEDDD